MRGKGRALDGLHSEKFNLILPTGQDFLVKNRQGEIRSQQPHSGAIDSRCQICFLDGEDARSLGDSFSGRGGGALYFWPNDQPN